MDISAVVSTLSSAATIASTLKDAHESLTTAEHKAQMAEVISALADAKLAIAEQQTELAAKQKQMDEMCATLNTVEDTVEYHGMRYRMTPDGKPQGRPYCEPCIVDDGVAILTQRSTLGVGRASQCPRCGRMYSVTEFPHSDES